ncbi:TPM domain-containing protein [Hymenobacter sp. H14-R3]|uniref:TPM domain-containing protein n=1 Tax=Hymenobacter sp. H14-R3 TaxID=3046308 RepID=UPI0024BBA332|nr:TPM domain-containing protein [Hymenobacter sp. H14-R3]MDJ0364419.1 TPM domain-containing protein [Hymenobacter sp. H14-R3]
MAAKRNSTPEKETTKPASDSMSLAGKFFSSMGCLGGLFIGCLMLSALGLSLWQGASQWLGHLRAPVASHGMPPRPAVYTPVSDGAGLLSTQDAAALGAKLQAFEHSSTTQLVVVTVPTLDGSDIADYAQKLYGNWGIGQRKNHNGLLVLVAAQEHEMRIQTGYGLEGAVPDAIAKRLITGVLTPAFKQEQYYAGLDALADQLIRLAQGETASFEPPAADERGPSLLLCVSMLMAGLLTWLLMERGTRGLWAWAIGIGAGATYESDSHSGSSSSDSSSNSWSSSDSSSDSSSSDSWGGGDSGGGGASGSW